MTTNGSDSEPVDDGADEDGQREAAEPAAVDPDAPGGSLFTEGEDDVEPNEPA